MAPCEKSRRTASYCCFSFSPLARSLTVMINCVLHDGRRGKDASLRVICRDEMHTVFCPLDRDVKWRLPVRGHSPPVQVKEPYIGILNESSLVGSFCKNFRV